MFAKEMTFNMTKRDDLSLSRLLCKTFIFGCKYGHLKRSRANVVLETSSPRLELCFGSFSISMLWSSSNDSEHSFTTAIADWIAVSVYARGPSSFLRMFASSFSTTDVSETSFDMEFMVLSALATVSEKVKSVVLSRSPESATWMIAATALNSAIFGRRLKAYIKRDPGTVQIREKEEKTHKAIEVRWKSLDWRKYR